MTNAKLLSNLLLLIFGFICTSFAPTPQNLSDKILSYQVNPKIKHIEFYWHNDSAQPLNSLQNLKAWLAGKHKTLLFAMNGGMYKTDYSPLGLFIQQGKIVRPLNTAHGEGNFYMQPNGVFYLEKDKKARVCKTAGFKHNSNINFATQSGPMLVIDGNINPLFKPGSANLNVRNGVGVLPTGEEVFAMSKEPVNFYDFAAFFKNAGCANALYLDGFVSRTYIPEKKWEQLDGNFGVIIGVTEP